MLEGAAVLLGAGKSTRFGSDKRKSLVDGTPLLSKTTSLYSEEFSRVVVVIRPDDNVSALIADHCEVVVAHDTDQGMSRSLAAGIHAIGEASWAVVGLVDMPSISISTLKLIKIRIEQGDFGIVRPFYQNQPGNPIAFSSSYFIELTNLSGDQGAREIVKRDHQLVCKLHVQDPGVCLDIDTEQDAVTANELLRSRGSS